MKSPAYPTQFLACLEGDHSACAHVDSASNVTWICQCECHPRDLAAPHNNYALFPLPPESVQVVLRYSGHQPNGQAKGLRRCPDCDEWRGTALISQDPLEWHLGLRQVECTCERSGERRNRGRMRELAAERG
jgi:hypothetical protein